MKTHKICVAIVLKKQRTNTIYWKLFGSSCHLLHPHALAINSVLSTSARAGNEFVLQWFFSFENSEVVQKSHMYVAYQYQYQYQHVFPSNTAIAQHRISYRSRIDRTVPHFKCSFPSPFGFYCTVTPHKIYYIKRKVCANNILPERWN